MDEASVLCLHVQSRIRYSQEYDSPAQSMIRAEAEKVSHLLQ